MHSTPARLNSVGYLARHLALLTVGLLATAAPTLAQTAAASSSRDYYYPQTRDPYRPDRSSDRGFTQSDSTTIIRPVIIDSQNSTVIGPVIVTPRTLPSIQYPTPYPDYSTSYPAQPRYTLPQSPRRTDAACMAFNELRVACQQ